MAFYAGGTTTLNWTIVGAAAAANATIDNSIGMVASPTGSVNTPSVSTATTFTLSFTGLDTLSHSCSAPVGIVAPPTGGLVPCGRLADNLATTDINESKPCTLCAMFYMLKNIINFVMTLSIASECLL